VGRDGRHGPRPIRPAEALYAVQQREESNAEPLTPEFVTGKLDLQEAWRSRAAGGAGDLELHIALAALGAGEGDAVALNTVLMKNAADGDGNVTCHWSTGHLSGKSFLTVTSASDNDNSSTIPPLLRLKQYVLNPDGPSRP